MHFRIRPKMRIINSSVFKQTPVSATQMTASQFLMLNKIGGNTPALPPSDERYNEELVKKHVKQSIEDLKSNMDIHSLLKTHTDQITENIKSQVYKDLDLDKHLKSLRNSIKDEINNHFDENNNNNKEIFKNMYSSIKDYVSSQVEETVNSSIEFDPNKLEELITNHLKNMNVNIDNDDLKSHIQKLVLNIREDLNDEVNCLENNLEEKINLSINSYLESVKETFKNEMMSRLCQQDKDVLIHINDEINDVYNTLNEEIKNISENLNIRLENIKGKDGKDGKDGLDGHTLYSFEKIDDTREFISLNTTHSIIERYQNNTLTLSTPDTLGVYKVLSLANSSVPFQLIKTNRATLLLERNPITLYFDGEKWCNIEEAKWLPLSQFGEKITGDSKSELGTSMDLNSDGTILVIGCPKANDGVGEILVYQRDIKGWKLSDKLVGDNPMGKSQQGFFVKFTLDSNKIVVGGPGDNNNTGAIWIFYIKDVIVKENGEMERIWANEKLVGDGSSESSRQGSCITVSRDNRIAVGAPTEKNGGSVYVYKQETTGWWSETRIENPNKSDISASFGCSVSFSSNGGLLAIGAENDDNEKGCVYLYKREADDYKHFLEIVGGGSEGDCVNMGNSVSLSADGKFLSFGGKSDNYNMGAVWIYRIHSNKAIQVGDKLVASNFKGLYLSFGSSISNNEHNVLFVGSQDDDSGTGAIYAFIYDKDLNEMIQIEKILGKDISTQSFQGNMISLSLDGRTLVTSGCTDNDKNGSVWTFS